MNSLILLKTKREGVERMGKNHDQKICKTCTMSSKKKKEYKTYLEFLEARINSENYKNSVSEGEYEKTLAKYKKEKLLKRLLGK